MSRQHQYSARIDWIGNQGTGTSGYNAYSRNHTVSVQNKADILCSSDPSFRGDNTRYNPEEMLVASLSSCHLLWYLHLCAEAGVVVVNYTDQAAGVMQEDNNGGGRFTSVTLHPEVTVSDATMVDKANELHHKANSLCFIANSCNFPVHHEPVCKVAK
ncbi:OsmC family protein [Mucilaginibacter gynuensis]|uniref:OsmC family protein n=1 Tax=Mucilaginibacter gynuensis TaxID=1302236 RepID=A0ABP8G925_9SPHI